MCLCILMNPAKQKFTEESGEREMLRLLAEVHFINAEVEKTLETKQHVFATDVHVL